MKRLIRECDNGVNSAAVNALIRVAAYGTELAAARALSALQSVCEDREKAGTVIYACLRVSEARLWSAVSVPLLFRSSPDGLDRYLGSDSNTGQARDRDREYVVNALLSLARDRPERPEAAQYLAATDLPMLVTALVDAFKPDLPGGRHYLPDAAITAIALANPHVVPTPNTIGLAVAKGRTDLVDLTSAHTIDDLLFGCASEDPTMAKVCRRHLRALPPGPGRERLCSWALMEDGEATTAVVGAGYLPEHPEDRAALLFICQRWDEYDTFDPDGELLYRAYVARRHTNINYNISQIAWQSGRPDPATRYLAESPSSHGTSAAVDHHSKHGPSSTYGSDFGGHYGGFHT
ncbi:hypothetical protein [Amycolatopsis sp. NPDC051071]|uniref:hypothetical protein n=1 Tax=Amycolatopsis sp. NPDC051071 TaxID=3154637 RepID=UPI00343DA726